MPTTAEYWDVDGVSLNELTQNLSSWGDGREAPPPLRGENVVIPGRAGQLWVPKTPDARTIPLSGWMVGKSTQELRTRWRAFRALLWRPDEQFALTRRWVDAGGVQRQATAQAEYVAGLEPVITSGGTRAEFSVTVRLSDPFFYGAEVLLADFTAAGTKTLNVLGDYATRKLRVELAGEQSAAALTVRRGATINNTLKYPAVPAGGLASLDVDAFRATETVSGTTFKTSGKVSHTGAAAWLHLPVGSTSLQYARTGVGTAKIFYRPAWH